MKIGDVMRTFYPNGAGCINPFGYRVTLLSYNEKRGKWKCKIKGTKNTHTYFPYELIAFSKAEEIMDVLNKEYHKVCKVVLESYKANDD